MNATKQNAQAISTLLKLASDHLMQAEKALAAALEKAQEDYPHNADRIAHATGGLYLAHSAITQDMHLWTDYARHRE